MLKIYTTYMGKIDFGLIMRERQQRGLKYSDFKRDMKGTAVATTRRFVRFVEMQLPECRHGYLVA